MTNGESLNRNQIEGEIVRLRSNIISYYQSAADGLARNYKIFSFINNLTIGLAIGVIVFSLYSSLNLNFFDRLAAILATVCGVLITASQVYWSRSRHAQQSGVYRSICIEAHAGAGEIQSRLILARLETDLTARHQKIQDIYRFANSIDSKLHALQIGLTEIPEKIDGLDKTPTVKS